ncbi:MAG: hypothetical protein AAGI45_07900 [Cyanobacteria bacterium P01_H01_bin.26]
MWLQVLISISSYLGMAISDHLLDKLLSQLTDSWFNQGLNSERSQISEDGEISDIHGLEAFQTLLTERNFRYRDLVNVFESEATLQAVLTGKEELTHDHVSRLSEYFKLSPLVFFPKAA